jgi:hypothetical protein
MTVADLEGSPLLWALCVAEEWEPFVKETVVERPLKGGKMEKLLFWTPACRTREVPQVIDWSLCGPIIDREKIQWGYITASQKWHATIVKPYGQTGCYGPDQLTAAMRARIRLTYPGQIEVPEQIVKGKPDGQH